MLTLYNKDNLTVLKELKNQHKKFKIIYLDPPYNTGNKFNYDDNIKQESWIKEIDDRISIIKDILLEDGCVIFSISEESLKDSLILLEKHFNYIYPPFVWLTKSSLNQNKVNTVNSVVHEYILVASNNKIETNLEELNNKEDLENKKSNYPLNIILKEPFECIEDKINNKTYLKFNNYEITRKESLKTDKKLIKLLKEEYNINLENQIFQKRTIQKGHGSERYYNYLSSIKEFEEKSLFLMLNVKDKNNLNGKFLLNNSYFQSIQLGNIKTKIPSFLGYYQPGIKNFQTAKPVDLMKRLIKAFSNENEEILDVYSGSGNVLKSIYQTNRKGIGIELDKQKTLNVLLKNLENIEMEIIK